MSDNDISTTNDNEKQDKDVGKYKNKKQSKVIIFPENLNKKQISSNSNNINTTSIDDLKQNNNIDI